MSDFIHLGTGFQHGAVHDHIMFCKALWDGLRGETALKLIFIEMRSGLFETITDGRELKAFINGLLVHPSYHVTSLVAHGAFTNGGQIAFKICMANCAFP